MPDVNATTFPPQQNCSEVSGDAIGDGAIDLTPSAAQAFFPYVDSTAASTLGILATPVSGTRDGNQEYRAFFWLSEIGGYLRALSSHASE